MLETMSPAEILGLRLAAVRERIAQAARRAGREPKDVTLIAVSKTHPVEVLQRALAAGAYDFGENRVQEAEEKIEQIGRPPARWHLIGHLQANKARRAVKLFDVIHTVDSVALVERLERLCVEEQRESLDVLIQVDLAGEATKAGAPEDDLPRLVEAFDACVHLRLQGLMILPPFAEDAEHARPFFRRLRELRNEYREAFAARVVEGERGQLSMGMSHDFEVAIEEGATMVRVGTAIFGARSAADASQAATTRVAS